MTEDLAARALAQPSQDPEIGWHIVQKLAILTGIGLIIYSLAGIKPH
jgi:hypothetical protein